MWYYEHCQKYTTKELINMTTSELVRELTRQVTLREDAAPPPLVDGLEWLVRYVQSDGQVGAGFPQDWASSVRDFVELRHR